MTTVTIPKELTKKGDLVVIPKSEYEEFLKFRRAVRIAEPTRSEKRAIERGRKELRAGRFISWEKLKNDLARRSR